MTDLKDLLATVANRAEPIDDLAERAVAGSVRRRRRTMITVPLAAAALAAVAVLVPGQLTSRGIAPIGPTPAPTRTATPAPETRQISIPVDPPPALPATVAEPALLAYAQPCGIEGPCTPWRVVLGNGSQWTVAGAFGDGTETGVLSVAPNGRRIAYLEKRNGSAHLVVHDLASGDLDRPLELRETVADHFKPSISWSPNSRWLGIDYVPVLGGESVEAPKATLVDTTLMRTRQLPDSCCVAGLPSEDTTWVPLRQAVGLADDHMLRIGPDGDVAGEVPLAPGEHASSDSWVQALISPDGKTFARVRWPDGVAELALVDASTGAVTSRRMLTGLDDSGDRDYELLGWSGRHTVLVGRLPGAVSGAPSGEVTNVYGVDVRDGRAWVAYRFSDPPVRVTLATDLTTGGTR